MRAQVQKLHEPLSLPPREEVIAEAQRSFTEALPRVEGLASAYLKMRRGERKDEAVAEVVAVAWKNYLNLSLQGRDVEKLLGKVVFFAAQGVRCGRGLAGQGPINDVMSPRARFKHGLQCLGEPREHERVENGSPAEQAAVSADFDAWLETLDGRKREIAEALASGMNTVDVGAQRGVTRAAIHAARLDLQESWDEFQGGG